MTRYEIIQQRCRQSIFAHITIKAQRITIASGLYIHNTTHLFKTLWCTQCRMVGESCEAVPKKKKTVSIRFTVPDFSVSLLIHLWREIRYSAAVYSPVIFKKFRARPNNTFNKHFNNNVFNKHFLAHSFGFFIVHHSSKTSFST